MEAKILSAPLPYTRGMWIDRAEAWFLKLPTPVAALIMLFGPFALLGYGLYRVCSRRFSA